MAPAPDRPVDGGMPTEALVAHVVVSKYADALPLYRQAQMLERQGHQAGPLDAGELGRPSVLVADAALRPGGQHRAVLAQAVFADDTTLPVLDPGRGRTKTGRLWCYAVDDRSWDGGGNPAAAYVYSQDRKSERPSGHSGRVPGRAAGRRLRRLQAAGRRPG